MARYSAYVKRSASPINTESRHDCRETILQFGTGNFLRAFTDFFVQEANDSGQKVGRVAVIQSTDSGNAELLNAHDCAYTVLVRGFSGGEAVDTATRIKSISRALIARSEWETIADLATSPDLNWVVSNTTEAGYALTDNDDFTSAPPQAFPAKLLVLLKRRYDADVGPLTILPCELLENNGDRLRRVVLELAERWKSPAAFRSWVAGECHWPNTLVDRIVTGRPAAHPLLSEDPLLTATEPFALWVIEKKEDAPQLFEHASIEHVEDVRPYQLRKVRILNGAHTALVSKARPLGFETVRAAVEAPEVRTWLEELLFEEIVPTVASEVAAAEEFARQTLERFGNPSIDHKLSAIALHHDAKVKTRLLPTRHEYVRKFGKSPRLLDAVLSGAQ